MKALIIKDLLLMKNQKKTMIVMLLLGFMYVFMDMNGFAVTFLGMILMLYATGTISYDEFDNGNPFLFSQPFTRRQYTAEKYLLAMLGGSVGSVMGVALTLLGSFLRGMPIKIDGLLATLAGAVLGYCFVVSFMLPMMLKNGAEKGRTAAYLVFAAIFLGTVIAGKILPESSAEAIKGVLDSLSPLMVFFAAAVVVAVVAVISFRISVGFMEKREF